MKYVLVASTPDPYLSELYGFTVKQFISVDLINDIGIYGDFTSTRSFNMNKADAIMLALKHPEFNTYITAV